ncbi:MAG: DUF4065 domain-containing protein [Bacilli bacterium]|nr:DUF4065 domain-containing protein [Bacilli bacterium]
MKKQFCSTCMGYADCKYNEKLITEIIDGIEIEYLEKFYICNNCGSKIYGNFLDYNSITANNELRKKTGLITIDEIKEILNKYSIGKKPLSLVLGLGEITLIRYLEGKNPSKENSDLLKLIADNPTLYEMYLTVNHDKITDIAYKKSLGKTKQIEFTMGKAKIYDVSLYLISKLKEIDSLSLQKLLYFANGLSNKFLGKHLIEDESEAWKYGPVYKDIYECFSYYGYKKLDYDELLKNSSMNLTDNEKKYLDSIIKNFGLYGGGVLREMSHLTDPWINTRNGLNPDESSSRIISLDDMDSYFNRIIKKYNIEDVEDISKYSEDLFKIAKDKMLNN